MALYNYTTYKNKINKCNFVSYKKIINIIYYISKQVFGQLEKIINIINNNLKLSSYYPIKMCIMSVNHRSRFIYILT